MYKATSRMNKWTSSSLSASTTPPNGRLSVPVFPEASSDRDSHAATRVFKHSPHSWPSEHPRLVLRPVLVLLVPAADPCWRSAYPHDHRLPEQPPGNLSNSKDLHLSQRRRPLVSLFLGLAVVRMQLWMWRVRLFTICPTSRMFHTNSPSSLPCKARSREPVARIWAKVLRYATV